MLKSRNKRIMLFSIFIVLIVAVPISFLEFFPSREPAISVSDGKKFYACDANFSARILPLWIPNVTASASIGEKGYPNSSLSLTARGYEHYTEGPRPMFYILINVKGSLPSNLHPSGLMLTQNLSSPGFNCSRPTGFFYRARHAIMTNTSYSKTYSNTSLPCAGFFGDSSWNFEFTIENHAKASSHSLFNFSVSSVRGACFVSVISGPLYFPHPGDTYYTTISAEILGLSKPVSVQVEFAFKDVI